MLRAVMRATRSGSKPWKARRNASRLRSTVIHERPAWKPSRQIFSNRRTSSRTGMPHSPVVVRLVERIAHAPEAADSAVAARRQTVPGRLRHAQASDRSAAEFAGPPRCPAAPRSSRSARRVGSRLLRLRRATAMPFLPATPASVATGPATGRSPQPTTWRAGGPAPRVDACEACTGPLQAARGLRETRRSRSGKRMSRLVVVECNRIRAHVFR